MVATPTQTRPPLRLRREPVKIIEHPASYCMQPYDMKLDLCDFGDEDVDIQEKIIRKAPCQNGVWMMQPAYARSIPFMVNIHEGTIWNRLGTKVVEHTMWSPDKLLERFGKFDLDESCRWLQCLRVPYSDSGLMTRFYVVVEDLIIRDVPQYERRNKLESSGIPQLGIKTIPEEFGIYLIPEFPESVALDLWAALHLQNQTLEREMFNGIVAKSAEAEFAFQKTEGNKANLAWQLHRFDNNY